LGLEATLQRKIAYANAAIGTGTVLPDQISDPTVEVLFQDTERSIRHLFNEDNTLLLEGGGSDALSGEEYRRRLGKALGDSYVRRAVRELPFGAGSGFRSRRVGQAGYVFCSRIGDHPEPWFRFVAADRDSWLPLDKSNGDPWISDDTLTCLIAADPDNGSEEQIVGEAALAGVFAAWERAQGDIYAKWTRLTDPANLQPQIEKALRDAIELVAKHGNFLGPSVQDDLMARLNGRWQNTVVRSVREVVRNEEISTRDRVLRLQEFVLEAGLPIPEQPKPLVPVRREDVRVVCWMAVSPAGPEAIAEQVGEVPLGDKL
jgi:hypothetical protein